MIDIAPEAPLRYPRTLAEAAFYNQGVVDLVRLLDQSARAIEATGTRKVHEAFAVAALDEAAGVARALLRYRNEEPPTPDCLPERLGPSGPAGGDAAAAVLEVT